jgi:hypothetical protein
VQDEFETMWVEGVVTYFKVLSQHLSREADKFHWKHQPG